MLKTILMITFFIVYVWARSPFPDLTTDAFQNECLSLHNNYRALHNVPPLQLNQSITAYAYTRCQYLSQFDSLSVGHQSLLKMFGENLFWSASSNTRAVNASYAIKSWYDESRNYNYGGDYQSGAGHFTQIVWKGTTQLGCAACGGQSSQWFEIYVVCDYQPPGNYIGQFTKNVFPPNGQITNPAISSPTNQWLTSIQPPTTSCSCGSQ